MSILPITVVSKHVGHPSSSSDMPSLLSCFRLPLLLARSLCPRMSRSCLHLSGPANLPQVLSSQRCLPSPHHSSPSPRHHYQAHIAISHHLSPLSSVLLFSIVLISIHVLLYLFITYLSCYIWHDLFMPSNISFLKIRALSFMSIVSSPCLKTHILGAQ